MEPDNINICVIYIQNRPPSIYGVHPRAALALRTDAVVVVPASS